MPNIPQDFISTFNSLRAILKKYDKYLTVVADREDKYDLNMGYSKKYKKVVFFGGVHIMKNYVSFHLMSVYAYPKLLDDFSPELKKRMHGKSCFNFKTIDDKLLKEISELTKRSYEFYKKNLMD